MAPRGPCCWSVTSSPIGRSSSHGGDVVIDPHEYRATIDEFTRTPCAALLTLNAVDDPWRGAAVYVDAQWNVLRLVEKPPRGSSQTGWNNAGLAVLTPGIFDYAARLQASPRGEYELPHAIAAMAANGCRVRARPLRGFWSDLGTPADLAAAEATFIPLQSPRNHAADE